jgi:hypothetical protein
LPSQKARGFLAFWNHRPSFLIRELKNAGSSDLTVLWEIACARRAQHLEHPKALTQNLSSCQAVCPFFRVFFQGPTTCFPEVFLALLPIVMLARRTPPAPSRCPPAPCRLCLPVVSHSRRSADPGPAGSASARPAPAEPALPVKLRPPFACRLPCTPTRI